MLSIANHYGQWLTYNPVPRPASLSVLPLRVVRVPCSTEGGIARTNSTGQGAERSQEPMQGKSKVNEWGRKERERNRERADKNSRGILHDFGKIKIYKKTPLDPVDVAIAVWPSRCGHHCGHQSMVKGERVCIEHTRCYSVYSSASLSPCFLSVCCYRQGLETARECRKTPKMARTR